jgi:nucleotide-binding universal stress UspA family protein
MQDPHGWLAERLRRIVVATDFEVPSSTALHYASSLAQRFSSSLSVLHVFQFGHYSQTVEVLDNVPSMERRNAGEQLCDFVTASGGPDLEAEQVVVEGTVPSEVVKTLLSSGSDLLVIGTQGVHRGLDRLLMGSNSEALMLGSPCPTLTVGPHVPESPTSQVTFQKVMYVADLSMASTAAATFADKLGRTFGVETEVYQLASKAAKQDMRKLEDAAVQYCDVLRFVDAELPNEWFSPQFQISRIFDEELLMAKASEPSNLIVLGVQPASFLQRHLHTSLAYRILTSAASPILTIPARALCCVKNATLLHGCRPRRFFAT